MDIRVFLHNKVRGTSDVTAPEQRPGVGGVGSPGPLPSLAAEQIHGVGPVVPPPGHTLIHGPVSGPVQRLNRKLRSVVEIGQRLDHQLSAPDLEFGLRALEGLQ